LIAVAKQPKDYGFRRPTWTQELLVLALEKVTEIKVSCTTISRLLKRNKARLGRPKPIVRCPWKKSRRMRRLRELRRLINNLPAGDVAVYLDEVDIHLNPKIGPDWMLRGMQKTAPTPGKNEKRYLAGALNASTGLLTWVEGERKTSDLFIAMLWRLLKDYPDAKCIHVVLDNFKIHSSVRTRLALAQAGPRLKLHSGVCLSLVTVPVEFQSASTGLLARFSSYSLIWTRRELNRTRMTETVRPTSNCLKRTAI
jgi:hypothetical protein